MAIMMDNASNNDTMMEAIESRFHEAGIEFSAQKSRMRCMPHTIHLAAIKVCSLFNCEVLWFKHWC
jgi:G:T-mismatch repair DNA endonuclease (very short patch repair protein)